MDRIEGLFWVLMGSGAAHIVLGINTPGAIMWAGAGIMIAVAKSNTNSREASGE